MASVAEPSTPDRVTLEIKGAKLNVAIQNALRRRRSQDKLPSQGCGPPDVETSARNTRHEGAAARQRSERQHSPCSGPKSSGGGSLQDAGPVKEAALLKAAVESLRAGIRDKEDAVTDLEREKEALVEQVARLDSVLKENVQLTQKISGLEVQAEKLQAKLSQAEAGQALTMKLVETLKSAQIDLRTAHGQVAQRCAELESLVEDSQEAIRRGDSLLQRQQLKIESQSRQLKRQAEDLNVLRDERELQLTKADRHAAELAQALRRERAEQGRIADTQAEVEALKQELEQTRETFSRQRLIMRKNQEVIDIQEKAVQDARSELLSLSLEAEKQSARHQEASADAASEISRAKAEKDGAVREIRALRLEKEDLKAQLEESCQKRDEAIAAIAAAKNNIAFPGRRHRLQNQQNAPAASTVPSSPTGAREHPSQQHQNWRISSSSSSSSSSVQHQTRPSNKSYPSSNSNQPERLSPPLPGPSEEPSMPPANQPTGSLGALCRASEVVSDEQGPCDVQGGADTYASAADAGGGGAGGVSNKEGGGRGDVIMGDVASQAADGGRSGATDGGETFQAHQSGDCTADNGRICSAPARAKRPQSHQPGVEDRPDDVSQSGGGNSQDGSGGGVSAGRRSRPRPDDADKEHKRINSSGRGEGKTGESAMLNLSDEEFDRKRARTLVNIDEKHGVSMGRPFHSRGNDAALGQPAQLGVTTPAKDPKNWPSKQVSSSRSPRPSFAPPGQGFAPSASMQYKDSPQSCPCCGDSPYGLMINCRSCGRQYHSSCVPEGQRSVGKSLAAVFHCVRCNTGTQDDQET